ncbi:MAG: hypothetical protein IPH69_05265 [Bacteroidales bacterium]|nr:hypothetical protein [Bacteroidales bacterium]
MKKVVFLILLLNILFWNGNIFSQDIPHSVSNTGIYNFLDELANNQVIEINSAVKPYSRLYIANKLKEAEGKKDQLNTRQQKELEFYLLDFGKELNGATAQGLKGATVRSFFGRTSSGEGRTTHDARRRDLFYYRDSLFSLTVNPILGGEMFNNSAGNATYWRNGAEARAYVGNWGFYASLRDNHEKPLLGKPEYLTQRDGGHLKGSTDWSEMQGGVTYSWKWGNAGLVKERQQWGNNYNGANIFGGNNPSFTQVKLQITPVKWFSFNYFHGWLNSQVVDSTSSYWVTNSYGTDYREVYHKKFVAANMFTFTPFKNLNLSAGNSIVYSDENMNPAYLIPLFFYKSVDHSLTSGIDNMNSQLYFDISSRQIKHLHVYGTLFIDELSVSRFSMKDEWNFFSWKAGFRLTDLPVTNLSFTTEFTYTYPLTFQHYVPTLTFETASFNLGHYMKDNSREWYAALNYRPLRTLDINLFFTDAIRGPDYTALGTDRLGNPPLSSVEWHNTTYGLKASYQVINDLYTWVAASQSNIRGSMMWMPEYFQGKKTTLNAGVTFGF